MQISLADGTRVASLRWAAPVQQKTARSYDTLDEGRHALWTQALRVLPDGDLRVGGDGAAFFRSAPGFQDSARVEHAPDGGIFAIMQPKRGRSAVEHHARGEERVLGRIKHQGADIRTALLADGSLVVLLFDAKRRGGPVGLYRARSEGKGSLEVLQPFEATTDAMREVVAVGRRNFLVPSPRGVWFVTGSDHPLVPGVWPPIHVYSFELVGERLELTRPPFALPQERFDRPFGACAIAGLLAIGTNGASIGITLTDGVDAQRAEGSIGGPRSPFLAHGLVATPRGDALIVALGGGIGRCELVREGDPRLAEPPYVEPKPVPEDELPPPPPPPRRKLEDVVDRVRLLHVIHVISALHFGAADHFAFEGDRVRGRFHAFDGSGNHLAIGWDEGGVVVCSYDHDGGELDKTIVKEFWADLADDRRKLGKALARWKPPINGAAWFSAADDTDGTAGFSEFARWLRNRDDRAVQANWKERHSISDAQLDLARWLVRASATGRHTLTDAEAAIALEHPEGGASPNAFAIDAARKHLRAVGVDWP
ncbi:MAG TPA: hypothetical protein VGM56_20910 [Byssovorax sp.]|jgi:hypothetical protein